MDGQSGRIIMKKVVFFGTAIILASIALNQKPALAMGGDDKPAASTAKQDFDAGEKAIKAAKEAAWQKELADELALQKSMRLQKDF